jgi:hypothetical protein
MGGLERAMTDLFWLAGLGAFLFICYLIGRLEERREEWHLSPWRYECFECRTGYHDPRAFVWHRQAEHATTYDDKEDS